MALAEWMAFPFFSISFFLLVMSLVFGSWFIGTGIWGTTLTIGYIVNEDMITI
jgi:hypothetical protein